MFNMICRVTPLPAFGLFHIALIIGTIILIAVVCVLIMNHRKSKKLLVGIKKLREQLFKEEE